MRIGPLGAREIVAAGLLVVAVIAGISVTLLRADNESQKNAAEQLNGRSEPETTATPANRVAIAPPAAWIIEYKTVSFADGSLLNGPRGSVEKLNLDYAGAPFGDMRDNNWAVVAEASIAGGEGEWSFEVEYRGSIEVRVDGHVVVKATSDKVTKLPVALDHPEGDGVVQIEARDVEGRFVLRWP